jgi:hypothetical protein
MQWASIAHSTHVELSRQCARSHAAEYEQVLSSMVQLAHPHGGTLGQSRVALPHGPQTSIEQYSAAHSA